MNIVVVMPSRGRPARARRALRALRETASLVSTSVVLAVDETDPTIDDYRAIRFAGFGPELSLVVLRPEETGDLVRATNTVSMRVVEDDPSAIIANLGDDHIARTWGWDAKMQDALRTPGIAYGDDRLQGERLPTAPFISGEIVNALGWYALPECSHLFIDNAWRDIGMQTGTLRYVPSVVIEHVHPLAGKAKWDEGYERANGQATIDRDREAYETWRDDGRMADAVERVRRVIA